MEHEDFIKKYKNKEISVYVKRTKAVGLILSKYASQHYKPGVAFWGIVAVIFLVASPITFFFTHWIVTIGVFMTGLVLVQSTMEVAADLVSKEMIENENFFQYILNNKKTEVFISE